jgi:hypothetical protein
VLFSAAFELRGALMQLRVGVDGVGVVARWLSTMTRLAQWTMALGVTEPTTGEQHRKVRDCDRTTSEMRGSSPKIILGDS